MRRRLGVTQEQQKYTNEVTNTEKVKDSPREYAATIAISPLTALRMLEDFITLNPGDAIVQNGDLSIVGLCIIQLSRYRGINSINIIKGQDLSLRGFWLRKWMSSDKADECGIMIDYLLDRAREGNLKYEMKLVPLTIFTLHWILGKLGSQSKQVLTF